MHIEKISLTDDSEASIGAFLETGPGANVEAIFLPVNRNIDEKYNKVLHFLYIFFSLPLLLFLAAVLTNARFRLIGLATIAAVIVCALNATVQPSTDRVFTAPAGFLSNLAGSLSIVGPGVRQSTLRLT